MGIIMKKLFVVKCDKVGCKANEMSEENATKKGFRKALMKKGWTYSRGVTTCPKCKKMETIERKEAAGKKKKAKADEKAKKAKAKKTKKKSKAKGKKVTKNGKKAKKKTTKKKGKKKNGIVYKPMKPGLRPVPPLIPKKTKKTLKGKKNGKARA